LCAPGSSAPRRAKQHYKGAASCSSRLDIALRTLSVHLQLTTDMFMPNSRLSERHELQLDRICCSSGSSATTTCVSVDVHCSGNVHCLNKILHRRFCMLLSLQWVLMRQIIMFHDCGHFEKTNLKCKSFTFQVLFKMICLMISRTIFCLPDKFVG
jgi:hypothetical protein